MYKYIKSVLHNVEYNGNIDYHSISRPLLHISSNSNYP